ncbi:MAG: transposase [Clostridia bacterium]|nr:transposase [Clostridia bacterium]
MARKTRIHYEGALYHVICRGNNKEYVFKEDKNKEKYLQLIRKYKEKYSFKVYAYCIMGNHVHMLIEVGNIPLNKIMQGVQQAYTYYYNKRNNRSGHVFEQRYKAILCDKEEYLLALIRYIHQNPVRAGIKEGLNYQYCSHKTYIENSELGSSIVKNVDDLVDVQFPLSLFGEESRRQLEEYIRFVGEEEELIPTIKEEDLISEVEECKNSKCENKEYGEETLKYPIDTIITAVCSYCNIKKEEVRFKIRTRKIVEARKIIIYMAKEYSDITNKELSELINVAQPTISNIITDKTTEEKLRSEISNVACSILA